MEGREVLGGGRDSDVREAVAFGFGIGLAFREFEVGGDTLPIVIEEVDGLVVDGGVSGAEEGFADGDAEDSTFGVDGIEVLRDDSGEGIIHGAGRYSGDMGLEGSKRSAEGNFLRDRVARSAGKGWEGDGVGSIARSNDDGVSSRLGVGGNGGEDGGDGVLGHGRWGGWVR